MGESLDLAETMFQTGTVVARRYRLERPLGEGGMGVVWSAVHTVSSKRVALKLLKRRDAEQPDARRRLLREARALSAVKHPNVVAIHDVLDQDDGAWVIVMDLLDGETLGEKLKRERTIAMPDLASVMIDVVSAVGAAHDAGIVHRDLKPENVFLAREGGYVVPKVLDFGIAKHVADTHPAKSGPLTASGTLLGTAYYMSPEQVFGESDVDHRADVWALGVIFYECLSGVRPTEAANAGQVLKRITQGVFAPLAEIAPDVPPDVAAVVMRMLAREREARPELAEVRRVLERHGASMTLPIAEALALAKATSRTEVTEPPSDRLGSGSRAESDASPAAAPAASPARSRARIGVLVAIVIAAIGGGALLLARSTSPAIAVPTASQPITAPSSASPSSPPTVSAAQTAESAAQTASAAMASAEAGAVAPLKTTARPIAPASTTVSGPKKPPPGVLDDQH